MCCKNCVGHLYITMGTKLPSVLAIPTKCIIFSSPEPLGSQGELIVYQLSRRPSVVCPPFLAHLSRRLIGELIVYPWIRRPSYVVRPSVVRRRPQCSNIFFSETAWPIKAKFYVEPPWVGGTKFCSRHLGHMTKMATTPIYGKNPSKIFFSRTGRPIFTKLGM